jgi:hypothetical protein
VADQFISIIVGENEGLFEDNDNSISFFDSKIGFNARGIANLIPGVWCLHGSCGKMRV